VLSGPQPKSIDKVLGRFQWRTLTQCANIFATTCVRSKSQSRSPDGAVFVRAYLVLVRWFWGHVAYSFSDRLQAFRQTKIYDLCAAAPLVAWYLFGVAQTLSITVGEIALIRLVIQTDVSVLSASLVLSAISKICSLAFLAILVVMFIVRCPPKLYAKGLYPRFVALAGTWVSVGIVQLPPRQLSLLASSASILLIIAGTSFAACSALALARSISIMPEARRLVTRGPYSLIRHPRYLGEMAATAGLAMQYLMP
jgi:protein-S-isoprenylcysteine O-methyltransferase Ste14